MAFQVPEKYRVRKNKLASTAAMGNNGVFSILAHETLLVDDKPTKSPCVIICVASDQQFWEMVSVTVNSGALGSREPSQQELKHIRNLFWGDSDYVFTFYPGQNYKADPAPIVQLLSKPGWKMPEINADVMGLEKKNLIQRLTDM